jgi:sporulation protein YlmC with PRC-barrel domain
MTAPKHFDLNIQRVLEDWGVHSALREVIANALDEHALTNTKEVDIFKDTTGRWHVRDYGRGLKYKHLTQNENQEKQSRPDLVIGKFGVGLKDALATFDRRNIKILVTSRHGDITITKSTKHGFSDITTLHAVINEPTDPEMVGTEFVFEGVKDKEMAAAKEFFLRFSGEETLETTSHGSVLQKGKQKVARIYITGLRVAEEQNLLCSYNITAVNAAIRKALNRERMNVGRTAYVGRIKDVLLACRTERVAQLLVEDLQHIERGTAHDELSWIDVQVHACKLLNAKDNVIFVTAEDLVQSKDMVDHAIKDGHRKVLIPDSHREKLKSVTDYRGKPIRILDTYTKEWNESFTFEFLSEKDLTPRERAIFKQTGAIFKLIGGKPRTIKAVLISRTMRMESFNHREACGIWEPDKHRIIIKRDQLKDLRLYAGTLLHEIAHATSGASDVSAEFEHAPNGPAWRGRQELCLMPPARQRFAAAPEICRPPKALPPYFQAVTGGTENADKGDMNVNSVSSNLETYIESILGSTGSGTSASGATGSSATSVDSSSQESSAQLSPFASILSQLQQMQESSPTEYQQVTSQISTNLQSAAQTASADGDTSQASELNQLATDFQNASQNNTLPNIQDLAQAIGGGGGHHHHMWSSSADSTSSSSGSGSTSSGSSSTSSSSDSTGSSSGSNMLSQLMSMIFGNNTSASQTNDQLNPLSIIENTLNGATQS